MEQKVSHLLRQCSFQQLKQIHAFITTSSLSRHTTVSSQFLRRSTEFGHMEYAELFFFSGSDGPEILLWNAMIRGYAYNGPSEKCIHMYEEMPERGLWANNYTYPYVFDACTLLGYLRVGKKIHCRVIKAGFEWSSSVGSSLLNFYLRIRISGDTDNVGDARNERLNDGRRIFDGLVAKSVGSWNRMIFEYANLGEVESARRLFDQMPVRDVVSWNCMISGYLKTRDLDNAMDLFEKMPQKNVVSWTSMIGAFADSEADLSMARRLFEDMPERNVVSWNCIISSYTRHRKYEEALDLFFQMQSSGVVADGFTFVSVLLGCSSLGALEIGKWVHLHLMGDGFRLGAIVGTSLVEMYARCGDIDSAFRVFIKMASKDVFCWNVMIKSLAIHGRTQDSMKLFAMMTNGGLKMNEFTFTSVLFACNHGGLVNEGRQIFGTMEGFGIRPKVEHYSCLIDLLSRDGQVEEAVLVMKEMPFEPDIAVWGALLGGCRVRNEVPMAEKAMERVTELKTNEAAGVYVLLSNIYAASEQWGKALRTREKMEQETAWKIAGYSRLFNAVIP